MDLLFLGTGAAEGSPAMYCRCESCIHARQKGGKDIRTRSSFRIGGSYQIDLNMDTNWQMRQLGIDMYDIDHLFITHTHTDHFQFEEIVAKTMSVGAKTNERPLNIYMSEPAKAWLERFLSCIYSEEIHKKKFQHFRDHYQIHGFKYFHTYRVGELVVDTLKSSHRLRGSDEFAMNYLFRLPDGRHLLYALDTGWYPEETWAFLRGKNVDILILDCTFGARTDRPEYPEGHLDNLSFLKMLQRMAEIQFIDKHTQVFATHISPHQGLFHDGLQQQLATSDFSITVAYDGLTF